LAIINEHASLEGSGAPEIGLCDLDELHPKYLPRKEMLSLLVDLLTFMNSKGSRHTQSAMTALIAVSTAASDKPGLAIATDGEIEVNYFVVVVVVFQSCCY
jgi:hypothetical protein